MELSGWGRHPVIQAEMTPAHNHRVLQEKISGMGTLIAYGYGRSYGDSALAKQVVGMRPLDRMIEFEESTGLLTCEAGVLFADIVKTFLPRGWFLKVTPGTKYITVGGAVAADIHGKNHHIAGCFGDTVSHLKMIGAGGETVHCSRDHNSELFRATCGGMGLTGIIFEAAFYLTKVPSATISMTTIKTRDLVETFEAFEKHADTPYSVAWVDCLAKGGSLGRSLVMLGEFEGEDANTDIDYRPSNGTTIPKWFPGFLLNNASISVFNKLYYAKAQNGSSKKRVGVDAFFYPLDRLLHWNRIYGKSGLIQYQFILPKSAGVKGMEEILQEIAQSGIGSFLAVLKLYGPANDHYLSFPMEGYSLALDFKVQHRLPELLDRLDRLVLKYSGRIYLAKDARVSREVFEQGYPQIEAFRALRKSLGLDRKFRSMQSDRLGL